MAYDNTNRGALFVNDRKERDTHPDRTGSINVDGVEYFIDAWEKTSSGGKAFLSLSVKRKNNQGAQQERQQRPSAAPAQRPAPSTPQRQPSSAPPARRPPPPSDPDLDELAHDDIPF